MDTTASTAAAAWDAASAIIDTPQSMDDDSNANIGNIPISTLITGTIQAIMTAPAASQPPNPTSKPPLCKRTPPSPVFIGLVKWSQANSWAHSTSRKSPPVEPKETTVSIAGTVTQPKPPTTSDVFGMVEMPRANRGPPPAQASSSTNTATKAITLPPDVEIVPALFIPPEYDSFAFMDDKMPQKKKLQADSTHSIIDVNADEVDITGSDDAKAKADKALADAKALIEAAQTTLFPSFRKDFRDYRM
ncbi:hypothetical protein FRB99_004676, partial [Tulasnella sp. 403]